MTKVIKYFIDIDDQRAFDGSSPYIHWFEDKQSINLIYIKRLCFVLNTNEDVYIKIPTNDIFHVLTDPSSWSEETTIDHFNYKDLSEHTIQDNIYYHLDTIAWNDNTLACCYILASSPAAIEAREFLYIKQGNNEEIINIGADFYEEREELSINISNQGTTLPETIQRAIYDSNVHEEAKDNILMNRKYKELLMDYMNILGTRGSYSSLINSLSWFGYGDNIKLKEFWKHSVGGINKFEENEITSTISNKLSSMLTKYAKTTYCGIFYACQQESGYEKENIFLNNGSGFLAEPNPELQNISLKWSREDMSIKMALLGNFFETYFMPVHLDLIASTIEDIVYANIIKIDSGYSGVTREDYIIQDQQMSCSIKDNDVFILQDIHTSANNKTYLSNKHQNGDTYASHEIIGVNDVSDSGYQKKEQASAFKNLLQQDNEVLVESDFLYSGNQSNLTTKATLDKIINIEESKNALNYDADQIINTNGGVSLTDWDKYEEIKTILLNTYHGPGCIIPFQFVIPCVKGDVIYKEEICLYNDQLNDYERREFNNLFYAERDNIYDNTEKYTIRIVFNMLFTRDKFYDISVKFTCNSGQVYTQTVHFTIVDTTATTIDLYKLKHNSLLSDETSRKSNDYMFGRWRHSYEQHKDNLLHSDLDEAHAYYTQYLPATDSSDQEGYDIKLKEIIVTKAAWKNSLGNIITLEDTIDNILASIYYRLYHEEILSIDSETGEVNKEDSIRLQYPILLSKYLNSFWLFKCKGDVTTISNTIAEKSENLKDININTLYNSSVYKGFECDHTADEIKSIIFDEEYNGARFNHFIKNLVEKELIKYITTDSSNLSWDPNDTAILYDGVLKAWTYLCQNYTKFTRGEGESKYYIWIPRDYNIKDKNIYKNTSSTKILADLVGQDEWNDEVIKGWYKKNKLDRIIPETSVMIDSRLTLYKKYNIITTDSKYGCTNFINRKESIYFPEDHSLIPLDRSNIKNIQVSSKEILVVVPNISYGCHITSYEWDFYNKSTMEHSYLGGVGDDKYNREHSISIKEPFIAKQTREGLSNGYYDIIFRYKLSQDSETIHQITLKGAFIQSGDINKGTNTHPSIPSDIN